MLVRRARNVLNCPMAVKNYLIEDFIEWSDNNMFFNNYRLGLENQIEKHIKKGDYNEENVLKGYKRLVKVYSQHYLLQKWNVEGQDKVIKIGIDLYYVPFFETVMVEEIATRIVKDRVGST
jgi:hypothetical protein